MHMTSPPWPIACAALSVITPLGVDTIAVPMPPSTLRNIVLAAIDAQPGPAHALDAVDDRAAVVILEVDGQHRLAIIAAFKPKSAM